MRNKRGNLFVVSGFSGSGKGTVLEWFRKREEYAISISCTSRMPRDGEKDGVHYYFISHEEFVKRAEEGYFLEHAIYTDHGYGTPAGFVEENLAAGKDVILEIELQGAMQVREKYPDTILIFITPPSVEVLRQRLIGRGTDTPENISKRLKRAAEESRFMHLYDYILVNDKVDVCRASLHELMQSTHLKTCFQSDLIASLREQFDKAEL